MVKVVTTIEQFEREVKRLWVRFGYANEERSWFSVSINSIYKHKVISVNPMNLDCPKMSPSKAQGVGETFVQALTNCLIAIEKEFERLKKEGS
ncbi:hypothetical protein WCX72_09820 [Sulfurimonas sp. HSL1-6]|uniref:hypothetical protein n=1 Tax=Thiomicrolovo immobilis TaxID=3131935 RepID=UPI0031F80518